MTSLRQHTILYLDHTAKMSGGEIALLNLLGVLDRTRFRPLVLLASDGPLRVRLEAIGVETHVLPLDPAILDTRKDALNVGGLMGRVRQLGRILIYARQVARWARMHDVHLIHTNSLKSDIYGGLAGRLAKIPVIWHVRDRLADGYLPSSAATVFRFLTRVVPQVVVTNSESTLSTLHLSARKRSAIVYSGVPAVLTPDLSRVVVYDGVPTEQFANPVFATTTMTTPVVSLFGRIAPWKGQHIFLQAAAQTLARHPETCFQVIGAPMFGEHEYECELHDMARQLGIQESVDFLGFREDVPALLAKTDIVVHASTLGEPFGQVVVEGMAAGKPVIATNGGALPEIIEDGVSGLLVPMGNVDALAATLETLLSDPARAQAIGRAGQARVRAQFTIERTARHLEAVYVHLLSLSNHVVSFHTSESSPVREKTAIP